MDAQEETITRRSRTRRNICEGQGRVSALTSLAAGPAQVRDMGKGSWYQYPWRPNARLAVRTHPHRGMQGQVHMHQMVNIAELLVHGKGGKGKTVFY